MNKYNCPKCNTEFSEGARFCQSCGCNLELEFILQPVCPKCHKTFPSGTKFCDIDGSKLTSPEKLIPKCIKCGKEYPIDIKFCPIDGGRVIPEALRYNSSPICNGNYPKASLGNRFLAYLLDGLIAAGLGIPAIILFLLGIDKLDSHITEDEGVFELVFAGFLYLIPLVYGFIKDGLGNGQSYGKKAVGLMVVYLPENRPCTKGESCLRTLIGGLTNIIPIVGSLIEPIMVLATEDGRRLSDKVANTQVIDKNLYNN